MNNKTLNNLKNNNSRTHASISINRCSNKTKSAPGIVLLVTLVLLVVLSMLGYTLTTRVAAQRHRNQYMADYQNARYACDSAVKYALATLEDINNPQLIARPNEPDFSDLFNLTDAEYEQYLSQWADANALTEESYRDDINDINDFNDVNNIGEITDFNMPDSMIVRGPYGPPWPFMVEPVEFEIGSSTVTIEIEDENAKYPIGLALFAGAKIKRRSEASFETFCEWMDIDSFEIDSLKEQLQEIREIKPFSAKFEPVMTTINVKGRIRRGRRKRSKRSITKAAAPASAHITDFAKLFHSSLIDTELLARPTVISDQRQESALKYMGMWASGKVNINSAPRQVLEAVFVFGGDEVEIAEEIIQRRKIKPFKDIKDLTEALFGYSDSIGKCKSYITTVSNFFTIKVTAISGVAKTRSVIAIKKEKKKNIRIATITG